jgi:hypothetical protein
VVSINIDVIFIVLASIPTIILLMQYRLTKSFDYLLFSGAFGSFLLESILFVIVGFDSESVLETDTLDQQFLWTQKISYFFGVFGWLCIFLIGYRARWSHQRRFLVYLMVIIFGVISIIFSFISIREIPSTGYFLGIKVHSNIDPGYGALFVVDEIIHIGQGYELVLILFRLTCCFVFLYAFLFMKNEYEYSKFNTVRLFWVSSMVSYTLAQAIRIYQALQGTDTFSLFLDLFLLWGATSFFIIAIFFPEGFLLSKTQVLRFAKLYDEIHYQDIQRIGGKLIYGKLIEYLEFIQKKFPEENTTSLIDPHAEG